MTAQTSQQDPIQEPEMKLLAMLAQANTEFNNHPLWLRLGCTPEKLFKAAREQVVSLNVPPAVWERTYAEVKQAILIKSRERIAERRPANLKMLTAIRA